MSKTYGTKDWSGVSRNFITGCLSGCKYCYAAELAIKRGACTPETWTTEVIRTKRLEEKIPKTPGRVMFPSTHDIHPKNLDYCLMFLEKLLDAHDEVLVVSKPHFVCIKAICEKFSEYKDKIVFRFSIGSINSETLKFWEPHAPSFDHRLRSLAWAFENGFKTSVSCEPMLDDQIHLVIEKVLPFVNDTIWIGTMNYLMERLKTNGYTDAETLRRAEEFLRWQSADDNIKALYERFKDEPKVRWKSEIRKVIGLDNSCREW